jgi:4-diphosphocytidyl-2-C-methyl-D-erythritol kinase
MWNLGLVEDELETLAAKLGSDVPFCLAGGTALAMGRGDQLTPLPDLDQHYVVLAKYRSLTVLTPWAYQTYRQQFRETYAQDPQSQEARRRQGPSVPLLTAINHRDVQQIPQHLHNDLERVVLPHYPKVAALREQLQQLDGLGTLMSGSGPTVFALADSRTQADLLADQIERAIADPDLDLWVTKFRSSGIQLID